MQFAHRDIFVLKASLCVSLGSGFVGGMHVPSTITRQHRTTPLRVIALFPLFTQMSCVTQ